MNTNFTTEAMVAAARKVAEVMEGVPCVARAFVDDWGRFGNFSLWIILEDQPQLDLRAVRRALKLAVAQHAPGAHLRQVVMPKRIYADNGCGRRDFSGWSNDGRRGLRGEIRIDLDFHLFDPSSNSFPSLQPDGAFVIG